MKLSECELISRIKEGELELLDDVYLHYKPEFSVWVRKKFELNQEDIDDIWQDVVIIFFENVKNNKLEVLRVKLKTYLFAIGKHLVYKLMSKRNRNFDNFSLENDGDESFEYYGEDDMDGDINIMDSKAFLMLGKSCQELLISRYYYGKSVQEISVQAGLSSKNTVSASISRCLKQLKNLIFKNGIQ